MSRPSTPTISTTTPLVGPTSPGIASVQRTDTSFARHSPYPQRSRTRTSRASSPSTPSKRRGPKTPLFLPGSRDSSATPGDRSSSQTPSISSDASFHTSNGEDVPIVVKDIVVNPAASSAASSQSRKRPLEEDDMSANHLMKEKKQRLVMLIVELESKLLSQNNLAQEMQIAKEEHNLVKQELEKIHTDQLDELQVKYTQEMDKETERHEHEINNLLEHHNKTLSEQTVLITRSTAECKKLREDLAVASQEITNFKKYGKNMENMINELKADKVKLLEDIGTLEKRNHDLNTIAAQQSDTIAGLKNVKTTSSQGLAQRESSTLDRDRPPISPESIRQESNTTGNQSHRPESPRRNPSPVDRRSRTPLPSTHAPRSALGTIKAMKRNHVPGLGRKVLRKVPREPTSNDDDDRNHESSDEEDRPMRRRSHVPGLRRKVLRKVSREPESNDDDDDRNNESSHEEDPPILTARSELKKLTQVLLQLVGEEMPTGRRDTRRRRAKAKGGDIDDPEERRVLLARLRLYFREKLDYEEDEDFQQRQSVTDDDVENFINGMGDGPNLNDLHFHCAGGRTSPWNKEVIRMMTEDIIVQLEEDAEYNWPSRTNDWWTKEMWNRFNRLMRQWAQGQRQQLSDGEMESDRALDSRLDEMRNSRLRAQRRRTRRIAKYDTRLRVCTHAVDMRKKAEDPHGDLETWEWLLRVVEAYGADGMSSDDSEFEGGEEVFYTTRLPWRRGAVTKYFDWMDDDRKDPQHHAHSKKGKRPGKRYRGDKNSVRSAIKDLPVPLYEPKWYNGLRTSEREVYGRSRKPLKWMSLALQSTTDSLGGRQMPEASGSRRNAGEGPSQARHEADQGRMDVEE